MCRVGSDPFNSVRRAAARTIDDRWSPADRDHPSRRRDSRGCGSRNCAELSLLQPPGVSGADADGGIEPRRVGLCGTGRETAATAIRVETPPIVMVPVHELRVFTRPTEDPSRAAPISLLVERLHATTVSHLGEIAIGRRAKRRSVESRLSVRRRRLPDPDPPREGTDHSIEPGIVVWRARYAAASARRATSSLDRIDET
jgi:hypothetical protein